MVTFAGRWDEPLRFLESGGLHRSPKTGPDRMLVFHREAGYVMVPPNISSPNVLAYQERVNNALAAALENNGVRHAVALSSIGADKSERTGPVLGLHSMEQKLEGIPALNVLFLRAGYFM